MRTSRPVTRIVAATSPAALVVAALALGLCVLLATPPAAMAAVPLTSLGGADRYEAAAAISRASYPATATAVVLAGGLAWPDALGGSALAGVARGPMLLSAPRALSPAAAAEIARLRPTTVYLLGGAASLSSRVESQVVAALPSGSTVVRLGGSNRYQVASRVASQVAAVRGTTPELVFVVSGRGFADALSCAAPAAAKGWPILLDSGDPAKTAAAVRASGAPAAVIVGGAASVSALTQTRIGQALGGSAKVTRIGGSDRYAVSCAVAAFAASKAGLDFERPLLASGVVFGDAVAGGPLAALRGSPVLLVDPSFLPDAVTTTLFAHRAQIRSLTVLGGIGSFPLHVRAGARQAVQAPPFSVNLAMTHVRTIAGFGPRAAGGAAERKAADYVAARLRAYGYTVTTKTIYLPGGRTSKDVIAERKGTAPGVIVIGGHMDSKPPSPGGNDNASGVGVTLELARCLAQAEGVVPTIRFIGFAAEEISGPNSDDHHFGARQYVASLSSAQRARIQTMIAIDMVGYGSTFNVRTMQIAPMTTVRSLQSWGRYTGQPLPFLKDPGRFGWSDHEAFEHVGIPVAWLEWREDPVYHTSRDTASHVSPDRVKRTGRLMRGWLLDLTPSELAALRP